MRIKEKFCSFKDFICDIKNLRDYKETIKKQDREYDVMRTYNSRLEQELKFTASQKDHYLKMLSKKNKAIKELKQQLKEKGE